MMENSDGLPRRRSLRRLGSVDSVSDVDAPATQNLRTGRVQQLSTQKDSPIPSRSPRRTRKTSENSEVSSSPLRRVTRASSQEKDIVPSPRPIRLTRRNYQADSDTDEADTRAQTKKRKSMIATPKVEQIIEEAEELNNSLQEEGVNTQNELELRNRSISKSPSVGSPPKGSLNGSTSVGDSLNISQAENGEKPNKIFKGRNKNGQSEAVEEFRAKSENNSILESPEIVPYQSVRGSAETVKTKYDEVVKELKTQQSKEDSPQNSSPKKDIEDQLGKMIADSELPTVQARRSIHEETSDTASPKTCKTPESGKKSVERLLKTPKSASAAAIENEKVEETAIVETPRSSKKSDVPESLKTPKSGKKSEDPASTKTPKSGKKSEELVVGGTPETVETSTLEALIAETPEKAKTPKRVEIASGSKHADEVETPTEARRSIQNRKKTPMRGALVSMDISETEEDISMDISKTDSDMDLVTETRLPLASIKLAEKPAKQSPLATYIDEVTKLSYRITRKSVPATIQKSPETDCSRKNRSWSVTVTNTADHLIDGTQAIDSRSSKSPKIIKTLAGKKHEKEISSDESDNEGLNHPLLDNEVEVAEGEEDSMSEGEREYLQMNEVEECGESLGSNDTNAGEIDSEAEDEDNDSFINDDGDVSDSYSLDSDERELEEIPKKRKSRIISQSSTDEDAEPDQATIAKEKSPEPIAETVENKISKKMKRQREENLEESMIAAPKRIRLSNPDESQLANAEEPNEETEQESSDSEEEAQPESPPKKKKQRDNVDLQAVRSRCDDYMSKFEAEKKAKLALKRERLAEKKAKKLKEEEAAAKATENISFGSSNGSNKENLPKKKKKTKPKTQKLLADLAEEKEQEDLATVVSKEQERLEKKRQRKLEKKLAKQQREAEAQEQMNAEESVAVPAKEKKKTKKIPAESEPTTQLATKPKKIKQQVETVEETTEPKKKKKKAAAEAPVIVQEPAQEEPTKKSKKRRRAEVADESENLAPKPKKLNILQQIENPSQRHEQNRRHAAIQTEPNQAMPLLSQKLKKVIPTAVEKIKKNKKKAGERQRIPEPRRSLPRPVFTTAGVFLEETITPFKFTSTQYVPINAGGNSSTNFSVMTFEGKKKGKKRPLQPQADFRSEAIARTMKSRDGSQKNIRNLLGKQNTF